MNALKKMFFSWGTMLAVIPFLVILTYEFIVVSSSAVGATVNMRLDWLLKEITVTLLSMIIFIGGVFVCR